MTPAPALDLTTSLRGDFWKRSSPEPQQQQTQKSRKAVRLEGVPGFSMYRGRGSIESPGRDPPPKSLNKWGPKNATGTNPGPAGHLDLKFAKMTF